MPISQLLYTNICQYFGFSKFNNTNFKQHTRKTSQVRPMKSLSVDQHSRMSKHNPKTNLEKINLYINKSDKSFPCIDEQNGTPDLASLLKLYFEDDDLVIAYEQTSVLHEDYFSQKIKEIEREFLSSTMASKQRSFIDFIEFWVLRDSELKVHYDVYDRQFEKAAKEVTKQYLGETIGKTAKLVAEQREKTVKADASLLKIKEKTQKIKQPGKYELIEIKQKIKVIHDYYSKKLSNVPKANSFDNLNEIFHTMNLTQFMSYVKQVGILNYNIVQQTKTEDNQIVKIKKEEPPTLSELQIQQNSKFTQSKQQRIKKYITNNQKTNNNDQKKQLALSQLQKFDKLNLNFFKRIFQKHSKQFVLNYEQFSEAIFSILKHIHNKQVDSPELFRILHLSQETQYKAYAKKLGIYFPEKQIVFIKPSQIELSKYKCKLPNIKTSKGYLRENYGASGYNGFDNLRKESKQNVQQKKIFRSRQQKKQHQVLGKMSLSNLKKFKLTQQQQESFLRMIGSAQLKANNSKYADISLGKSTVCKKTEYKNPTQHTYINRVNNGLLDRMDSRINGIMNKIR